jgi:hypothetical protein
MERYINNEPALYIHFYRTSPDPFVRAHTKKKRDPIFVGDR